MNNMPRFRTGDIIYRTGAWIGEGKRIVRRIERTKRLENGGFEYATIVVRTDYRHYVGLPPGVSVMFSAEFADKYYELLSTDEFVFEEGDYIVPSDGAGKIALVVQQRRDNLMPSCHTYTLETVDGTFERNAHYVHSLYQHTEPQEDPLFNKNKKKADKVKAPKPPKTLFKNGDFIWRDTNVGGAIIRRVDDVYASGDGSMYRATLLSHPAASGGLGDTIDMSAQYADSRYHKVDPDYLDSTHLYGIGTVLTDRYAPKYKFRVVGTKTRTTGDARHQYVVDSGTQRMTLSARDVHTWMNPTPTKENTDMKLNDITTTALEASIAETQQRLNDLQAQLKQMKNPYRLADLHDGAMIAFEVRFQSYGKTYQYAAVKADGMWYLTGQIDNVRTFTDLQLEHKLTKYGVTADFVDLCVGDKSLARRWS